MEKLTGCPICETRASKTFLKCIDYTVSRETFTIVECKECNFRYTNPRPNEEEIGPYYKAEAYISHTNSGKGIINSIYKKVRKYTLSQKYKLISELANGNVILDYGSGAGAFLNYFNKKGWDVKGVEADKETRDRVIAETSLDIISPAQISALDREKFDIVTLWHVLEHVHQLKYTIAALVNSLKKDGSLLIAVPNCNSLDALNYGKYWAAFDVPRHLYHFRPLDIAKLFKEFNLDVVDTLPMVFDSYYVSMLSEKHKAGGSGFFGGIVNGFLSNVKGDPKSSFSSQIYILRKNKAI